MRPWTLFLALSLTALPWAVQQSRPQLTDKKQRFALWFQEASSEYPDKQTILFEASGNPVHGYSRDQNLEFSCRNLSGKIRKTSAGAMLLTSGEATGGATVKVTDEGGVSTFTSEIVNLKDDGETASVTVPGSFTFTNTAAVGGENRVLTLTAAQGSFVLKSLSKKDENPLVSADVSGPVKVSVDQKTSKGKTVLYTLSGHRLTMRSEGTDKVLVLSGGVHATSEESGDEQPGFMGTMDGSEATVTMDADYRIKKIRMKGSPGTGLLREKGGT